MVTFPASDRALPTGLTAAACERALAARDARFDGLFYVGIISTHIYCRPVCPARVSITTNRRFFRSRAAAEQAGFRPCMRCRPELAPGRAPVDAVSRLGAAAAMRIEAGALNELGVTALAAELGVSARHLRRALEREFGVSPAELALTHRLLLAKQLLTDTTLPVTQVAFASGFRSLRRFNAAFRDRYRMAPSALRRSPRSRRQFRDADMVSGDSLRLTLGYRMPFDWSGLLALLRRDALPGVEQAGPERYERVVALDGHSGVITAADADGHLAVNISASLVPVLMPLLPRLRRLFDLDAEPLVMDTQLEHTDLAPLVQRRPGVRLPGVLDPFDAVLALLIREGTSGTSVMQRVAGQVVELAGAAVETGLPGLGRAAPSPAAIAELGADRLTGIGMRRREAECLVRMGRRLADGSLRLAPGDDPEAARAALGAEGTGDLLAATIVHRTMSWPDALPSTDPELLARAERWRPWRAYGAVHLRLATNGLDDRSVRHRPVRPEHDVEDRRPRRTAVS